MTGSMVEEMERAWEATDKNDIREVFKTLAPYLLKIAEQVKDGEDEEAVDSFFGLFGHVAESKTAHEDWYEAMRHGGEASEMVYLTDIAAGVYSHLRKKSSLPKEAKPTWSGPSATSASASWPGSTSSPSSFSLRERSAPSGSTKGRCGGSSLR